MLPGDDFFSLKDFAKGKISKYDLMDKIPLIKNVHINSGNLAQSEVLIEFENYLKFLEFLDVSEDDAWFANAINSYYGNFEFFDSYSASEDFKQGYGVWYVMDEENLQLLEKIAKLIYPKQFDIDDEDYKSGLADRLEQLYPREVNDIVDDYIYERNAEMTSSAQKHINGDIDDVLSSKGFELYGDGMKTNVAKLVSMFIQYNVPHEKLKNLIKLIFGDTNLGGWDENRYEYQDDENFDKESVNRTINRNLEKIYEDLFEIDDSNNNIKFLELIDRITKKFKVGVWYEIPKDKNLIFKITGFDIGEMKIEVDLKVRKKDPSTIKNFKFSEDSFNNLLYQPELFKFGEY